MKFLSVCSGIEAASCAWNPIGWKAVAFSEIEPFPCAVLARHYPDTPNWGDMTKFQEWPNVSIDLLCGGTPCQSFSVAGLRKGLDDPRGNLMLTFGAIAAKYKPKWIMWENVPGVVSSNGGQDFTSFLDILEELGYICDIEILDAQYFGVAQRRRRVFVCGQHRDDLLSQKTDSSALTITQCLQEILRAILTEGCIKLGNAPGSSALPMHSRDGATRRMRLFGLDGGSECWPMLRENLLAAFQRFQQGQKQSGAPLGESEKEPTQEGQSTDSQAESLFTLTELSLKSALDEAFEVMRLFTTSMPISPITQAQIYTCSRAALLIAKLTLLLSQSSPAFWDSALSSLTVIEEYTNYARSTNSDLFGDVERVQAWSDFIEQAEHTNDAHLDIGIECAAAVLFERHSMSGHPAPSRQAGKVAPTITSRSTACGGLGTDFDLDGGLIPSVAGTLKACKDSGGWSNSADQAAAGYMIPVLTLAHGQGGAEVAEDCSPTLTCNHEAPIAAIPFDTTQITSKANFSNPKAGDPCHPLAAGAHAPAIAFPARMSVTQCASTEEVSPSFCAINPTAVATVAAFKGGQGSKAGGIGYDEHVAPTLSAADSGSNRAPTLLENMQVRRLTPTECERLQGFPEIKKSVNIWVCLDHQNTYAFAETQCLKSQRNVLNVEENESLQFASAADLNSSTNHQNKKEHVVVNALIDLERRHLQLRSAEKLLLHVNLAELQNRFPLLMQIESIARSLVQVLSELERKIIVGKVELHQNINPSLDQWSGSPSVELSGQEIGALASDAEMFTTKVKDFTRYTTSQAGLSSQNYSGHLKTLCCFVTAAISSCIQEKTSLASSCELNIEITHGYTNVPHRGRPAADGPRYKSLGNSWAVPCAAWIGERINAVEASQLKAAAA